MEMDPRTTAVVLIEYQNDFTSEGGALHDAVKGVMDEPRCSRTRAGVVDEAREAGATVMHAPITFAPGYGELGNPDKVYGILKGVIDSNAFVKGTWGAEICDEMAPAGAATSSSRASAAWTRSRPPTSTSSFAAARSRRSCWAASSPTAASSRPCARPTRRATTSSP